MSLLLLLVGWNVDTGHHHSNAGIAMVSEWDSIYMGANQELVDYFALMSKFGHGSKSNCSAAAG